MSMAIRLYNILYVIVSLFTVQRRERLSHSSSFITVYTNYLITESDVVTGKSQT